MAKLTDKEVTVKAKTLADFYNKVMDFTPHFKTGADAMEFSAIANEIKSAIEDQVSTQLQG